MLLRLRNSGGEVVEYAGSGVRAVELHHNELHNSRKQVIDADVLLHLMEESSHLPQPVQPNPQEVPHLFFSPADLVDEIPWEAAEGIEDETRSQIAEGDGAGAVDNAVGVGVAVGEEEEEDDVDEEGCLGGDVEEEKVAGKPAEEAELQWREEGGIHSP